MDSYSSGQHSNTVFGLDIGTTKICMVAASQTQQGEMHVSGFGLAESRGMKSGNVINMKEVTEAIEKVMFECSSMSGTTVKKVYVGVSGEHIRLTPSEGVMNISSGVVTERDKQRVKEFAKTNIVGGSRDFLHDMEQGYTLDDRTGITNPVGMMGKQLTGKFNIITGDIASISNMVGCCLLAGLEVGQIVLQPIASSLATLSEDEKQSGVALIDIGGGTTDIVVYRDGQLKRADVIPIGGKIVTQDIARMLNVGFKLAEDLKHKHGLALTSLLQQPEQMIRLTGTNNRQISRRELVYNIESTMFDIFQNVEDRLKNFFNQDFAQLSSGLVLTGGGSNLIGIDTQASEFFQCPVRCGGPDFVVASEDIIEKVYGKEFATAVGLAKYGLNHLPTYGGSYREGGLKLYHRLLVTCKGIANELF